MLAIELKKGLSLIATGIWMLALTAFRTLMYISSTSAADIFGSVGM